MQTNIPGFVPLPYLIRTIPGTFVFIPRKVVCFFWSPKFGRQKFWFKLTIGLQGLTSAEKFCTRVFRAMSQTATKLGQSTTEAEAKQAGLEPT